MKLQFLISVGDIPPNNAENVWHDYQKLITLMVRQEGEVDHAPPCYLVFGTKGGVLGMVSKEQAEKHMIEAFNANAKKVLTGIET